VCDHERSPNQSTFMGGTLAANKNTRSRKRRKRDPFAVVRGKVVERIEISTGSETCEIGILFTDRTYLGFDLDPFLKITPDFSDWKTRNYKPLKRWPPLLSE
jgi:hypothetical protein